LRHQQTLKATPNGDWRVMNLPDGSKEPTESLDVVVKICIFQLAASHGRV